MGTGGTWIARVDKYCGGTVELHLIRLDVFSQSLTDFRYGKIFENIIIGPRFDALLDGRGVASTVSITVRLLQMAPISL